MMSIITPDQAPTAIRRTSSGRWLSAALIFAVLAASAAATCRWTSLCYAEPEPARLVTAAPLSAKVAAPVAVPAANATLEARVAALEARLARITVDAASASSDASRAESLLIAYAARRTIDKGMALGYLEEQLGLRFGGAQPNAVATIIAAAKQPVTQDALRARLADLGPTLVTGARGSSGFWAGLSRELDELFVVRPEGAPSPAPARRLERALRFIDEGRIEAAVAEVETLPGQAQAQKWLLDARRFGEVRRALDVIETAAIVEPSESGSTRAPAAVPTTR